eukprot:TRINITY_DN22736_c0_g1_i1.p2 TRINITY_DN22736_c0_g1~~TRINITY_DN22736_c0_g1_i1.p2  ORF type:complete len:130 (+),score=17.27 TRINITY_DN22736_c0_g1_i1:90-479(+)
MPADRAPYGDMSRSMALQRSGQSLARSGSLPGMGSSFGEKVPRPPHLKQDWKWAITPVKERPSGPAEGRPVRKHDVDVAQPVLGGFFGVSRQFGVGMVDPRMRGGQLARDGWAGTFPSSHPRGCPPWTG